MIHRISRIRQANLPRRLADLPPRGAFEAVPVRERSQGTLRPGVEPRRVDGPARRGLLVSDLYEHRLAARAPGLPPHLLRPLRRQDAARRQAPVSHVSPKRRHAGRPPQPGPRPRPLHGPVLQKGDQGEAGRQRSGARHRDVWR